MANRLRDLICGLAGRSSSKSRIVLFGVVAILALATGVMIAINTMAATVTNISQTQGPTTGGQTVTITGTGFQPTPPPTPVPTVTFGGIECTNLTVISDSELTCQTPPHQAATVDVKVTVAGTTTTAVQQYTYTPQITSVTPNPISTNGGQITVHGQGFLVYPSPPTPTTLQEMTQEYCASMPVYNGTNNSAILTLNDPRGDGQDYRIAKLADNNCWTLNNLKLGSLSGTTQLTSADTNLASGYTFTLPKVNGGSSDSYDTPIVDAKVDVAGAGSLQTDITANDFYGYYYNWCAVKGGTPESCKDSATMPEPSAYDICPANWHLPTGGTTGDIAYLNGMMAGDGTFSTTDDTAHAAKWIFTGPFKGVYSNSKGGVNNFPMAGTYGNYWTGSPQGTNATMTWEYVLRSGNIIAGTQSRMRIYRDTVRCMATGGVPTPYTPAITVGGAAIDPSDIISVTDGEIVLNAPAGSAIASLSAPYYEGTVDVDVAVNGINAVPSPSPTANDLTYRAPMAVTSVSPASGPAGGGTNVTLTGHNFMPSPEYSDGTNSYTAMEYLKGDTGDSYIDIGYDQLGSPTALVDFKLDSFTSNQYTAVFGSRGGNANADSQSFAFYSVWGIGRFSGAINATNSTTTNIGNTDTNRHTLTMTSNPAQFQLSGFANANGTAAPTTGSRSMHLFGMNNYGAHQRAGDLRVYGFKLWKNGDLLRDFVPVCSSAGVGGMWDKVSGAFFGGTGFGGGGTFSCLQTTTVTFDNDGTPATCDNITVVNNTTITCTTTAHSVGDVKVTVNNGVKTATSTNDIYNYQPMLTAINPDYGIPAGGNTVTITGAGFTSLPSGFSAIDHIEFNGSQYLDTGITADNISKVNIDYQVNVTANNTSFPSGQQNRNEIFGTLGAASDYNKSFAFEDYTNTQWRTIWGSGSNFANYAKQFSTNFNSNRHIMVYQNKVFSIDGTAAANYTLAEPDGSVGSMFLGAWRYNNNVVGTDIFPMTGNIWSFQIWKSGVLAMDLTPVVNSTTGEVGFYDLVNSDFYKQNSSGAFTKSSVTPLLVTIGGNDCTNVVVVSDTQLTCTVPASNLGGAYGEGTVDVSVTVNGETATLANSYTYRAAMTVTAVTPAVGPVGGGTAVTLTGHNFIQPASLYVQDGLVLHYDGIENVGVGTHSNSATTWTDLSPSGNNMNIAGSFTGISYRATATTSSQNNVPILAEQPVTVEYVVSRSQNALTTIGPERSNPLLNRPYQMKMRNTGVVNYRCALTEQGISGIPEMLNAVTSYQFSTSYSLPNQTTCIAYVNGTQFGANSFVGGVSYDFGKFSVSEDVSDAMNLNIYAVRVYDHVLTPAELAKNAELDAQRFTPTTVTFDNGGTPAVCDNVVVVNNTTITCTTTSHGLGKVAVTVDNGAETATLAVGSAEDGTAGYRYLGVPSVAVTTTVGTDEVASGGTFVLAGTASDPNPAGQPLTVCATIGGVEKCANYTSGAVGADLNWSLSWTAAELGDGSYDFSGTPLAVVVKNTTLGYGDLNSDGVCDSGELCAVATWAGVVVVDTVPPSVSVSPASVGGGGWVNTQPSVTVSASVSGGTALMEVRYSWANDLGADCRSGGVEVSHTSAAGSEVLLPALGSTVLYACARDAAGNVATADGAYKWENIAPLESGVSWSPVQAPWNNGSAGVVFTLSGVSDTGGSGLASSNNYSCTTGTANGDTCTVTAYDNAGNYTVYTSPPNRVSTVGPQIDLSNPGDVAWANSSSYWTNVEPTPQIDVTDSVSGVTRIAYSWANDLDAGCTNGVSVANGAVLSGVSAGGAVLYVCAADSAGNVTQTYATYNYETTAPVCTGWSPAVAPWNQGTGVTFMPTGCSDTGGSGLVNPVGCTTLGVNGATCDVTVYDNAGNAVVLTSPPDNVDSVGPSVSFPDATGSAFVESDVPLVAKILLTPNLAPIAVWQYSLTPFPVDTGSGLSVCTGGTDIDLTAYDFSQPFVVPDPVPAGGFTVYSCAIDVAGNRVFGSDEFNWKKPIIPPFGNGDNSDNSGIPGAPGVPNTGVLGFVKNFWWALLIAMAVVAISIFILKNRYWERWGR